MFDVYALSLCSWFRLQLVRILRYILWADAQQSLTVYAIPHMREGAKSLVPTIPATLIWAIVTAVVMSAAGMPAFYVLVVNALVYGASAQLAVLGMLMATTHSPLLIIWLTAALVNLRFIIFSGVISPFFRHLPIAQRLLYGFLNTDLTCLFFSHRFKSQAAPANLPERSFFIGLAWLNFSVWQVGVLIGLLLAKWIPLDWGLEIASALTLLILVVKLTDSKAAAIGCVTAALCAVVLQSLPYRLWILAAIVVGVSVAMLSARFGVDVKKNQR